MPSRNDFYLPVQALSPIVRAKVRNRSKPVVSGLQDDQFGRQVLFDFDQIIVLAPLPIQASYGGT